MARTTIAEATIGRGGERRTHVLVFGGVLCAFVYHGTFVPGWFEDGAFVAFRYAEHWAQGFGPVFNPGEAPAEGYASFLWVALLAVGARLGGDIPLLSQLLGMLAAGLTLLLVYQSKRFIRALDPETPIMATLFLASLFVFHLWPLSGRETALFGMLLTLSLLLHFRVLEGPASAWTRMGLGLVLALAALTRPEGVGVALVLLADQAYEGTRGKRLEAFQTAAIFLALFLPWLVWRWHYYGALLPQGVQYGSTIWMRPAGGALGVLVFSLLPVLVPAVLAVLAPRVWRGRFDRHAVLPLLLLLYGIGILLAGRDLIGTARLVVPFAAPLCLMAAVGARRITPSRTVFVWITVAVVALNVLYPFAGHALRQQLDASGRRQEQGMRAGLWLRDRAPKSTVVATREPGALGYYSKLPVLNIDGGPGPSSSMQPDVIHVDRDDGEDLPHAAETGSSRLLVAPDFLQTYRRAEYALEHGAPLRLYVRKDAPFAREDGDVVFEDFESGTYDGWTLAGDCFGDAPAQGALPGQRMVQGFEGRYLMNTLHGGTQSKGRALSRPFTIRHNYIRFLIGGGYHPGETGISLVIDGEPVKSMTARNSYVLVPEQWDVSAYLGREGVIEILDDSNHPNGCILIDHIVFSNVNDSVEVAARAYTNPRFGLLPWLLLGAACWWIAAVCRPDSLSLTEKVLPLLLLLLFIVLYRTAWVSDDAYITMRTVDNFVQGRGLTWNVDERVQAFTHPLWMFLISGVYYFSLDAFLTYIVVSVVVSMAAVSLAVWGVASAPATALAGLVALLFSRAFTDFSTSGLENPLTHLLLALFVWIYLRRQWTPCLLGLLTLAASALVLNRMDLALLVAPAVGYVWLSLRSRKATLALILGGTPVALWMLFSLVYFGFPFPNTAYAKLGAGLARGVLMRQAFNYYAYTWSNDPVTLPLIFLGVAWPLAARNGRYSALSLGIVLYLAYVVRIGGDFMGHRFFAAPFFLAVLILMRMAARLDACRLAPATAAVVLLSFWAPHVPLLSGAAYGIYRGNPIGMTGVCNERAYYYQSTGMLHWRPGMLMPAHGWAHNVLKFAMQDRPLLRAHGMIGFQGFFGGPKVVLIDPLSLADPLLARLPAMAPDGLQRLPAMSSQLLRIGHFERHIPEGYLDTRLTGTNHLRDENLAAYYDTLCLITRGPVFSRHRLRAIVYMNLGFYDHLVDWDYYRSKPPGSSLLL